jgi:hypothetical protein
MERREEVGVTVYTHNAMVMAVTAKKYIFIERQNSNANRVK